MLTFESAKCRPHAGTMWKPPSTKARSHHGRRLRVQRHHLSQTSRPTAPDTQFLIVDSVIENRPDKRHIGAVFPREYEATYLIGGWQRPC